MAGQKLSVDEIADIKAMVPEFGYDYVARWIGCRPSTVRQHANLLGVKPKLETKRTGTLTARIEGTPNGKQE